MSLFCFFVNISPYRQVQLKKTIVRKIQSVEKAYLKMLIVFVIWFTLFGLRHSYLLKFNGFFVFAYVCFSFCCNAPYS